MLSTEPGAGQLAKYVARGSQQIHGWFARTDAEIFKAILLGQVEKSLSGSAVEIGVHHGRSFIALCLGLQNGEKAYCIDIFESQMLNKDLSGRGDQVIFAANLANFSIDDNTVVIDSRSSQNVEPNDIIGTVGPARFFSIDGGHWLEIVQNDLRLAEASLAAHGIIALDDFHRPEWPNVSAGYFAWYVSRKKPLVPLALGFNKLYLCEEKWSEFYKGLLREAPFLTRYLTKQVEFQGEKIPVYQTFVRPEMSIRTRLVAYLKIFNPDLYMRLSKFKLAFRQGGQGHR
jgi:Methyltransferase domain